GAPFARCIPSPRWIVAAGADYKIENPPHARKNMTKFFTISTLNGHRVHNGRTMPSPSQTWHFVPALVLPGPSSGHGLLVPVPPQVSHASSGSISCSDLKRRK